MKSAKDVAARLGMPAWRALPYDAFVRAYHHAPLRGVLRLPFPRAQPAGWIFPVGCYNAGTTIIKDAILSHPDVVGMPVEGDTLTSALDSFEEGGFPRGMFANRDVIERTRSDGELDVERIIRDWAPWIRGGKQFLDKSISNSMRIPKLRSAFPGARFVCIVRSPAGVAAGIKKRSRPAHGGEYDDRFLRDQWKYFYETILADEDPSDTVFCSYESFIARPGETTVQLFRQLGLREVSIDDAEGGMSIDGRLLSVRSRPAADPLSPDPRNQILEHLRDLEAIDERSPAPAHGA